MYNLLESFSKSTKVFYFDTTDSSGYLLGDVLPFVEGYFKHQVLRNKEDYLKPMYGRRPFTQFYYEHFTFAILAVVSDKSPIQGSPRTEESV